MIVIGLCGGSGVGKSEISQDLSARGIPTVNCDAIYHAMTAYRSPCVEALAARFGEEILFADGALNRRKLAEIVFSGDPVALPDLNRITHGYILDEVRAQLRTHAENGAAAAMVDAPQLYESGFDRECDAVIAITADKETRIARIMARDGLSRELAEERINGAREDAVLRADYVIENNASMEKAAEQVAEIIHQLIADRHA